MSNINHHKDEVKMSPNCPTEQLDIFLDLEKS